MGYCTVSSLFRKNPLLTGIYERNRWLKLQSKRVVYMRGGGGGRGGGSGAKNDRTMYFTDPYGMQPVAFHKDQ